MVVSYSLLSKMGIIMGLILLEWKIKLIRGAFIVKREDAEKFISLLERYKIIYHVREVILTPQDLNDLRGE